MRYFIMMLMLLISNILNAQYLVLNSSEDIIVYPSDTTDVIFCVLPHSFVSDVKTDYSWGAKILCVNEERFKLEIVLDYSLTWETDPIIGWVDKKQCGVWLRANRYEGRIPIMDIHMNETLDGDFIPLDISGVDFEWICVTDIYKNPERHIYKVQFTYKGVDYSGWVPRCCPDPYNSCN